MDISKNYGLILLQVTQTVTDDPNLPSILINCYLEQKASPIERGVAAIINAIITQRRYSFCITSAATRDLIKSDDNWHRRRLNSGLTSSNYKGILGTLMNCGVIKYAENKVSRTTQPYIVTHPEILEYLDRFRSINKEQQLIETLKFSEKNKWKKNRR